MISLIEQEDKENKLCNKNKNRVLDGFLCFDLNKDIEILDKLIIRKSSRKNSFYDDLNRWLRNPNFKSFEVVAYFAARLMYSLNNYAIQHKMYYNLDNLDKTEVYGGMRIPYSDILAYVRAIGKIIVLSSFISASSRYQFANEKSLSKKNKKFKLLL